MEKNLQIAIEHFETVDSFFKVKIDFTALDVTRTGKLGLKNKRKEELHKIAEDMLQCFVPFEKSGSINRFSKEYLQNRLLRHIENAKKAYAGEWDVYTINDKYVPNLELIENLTEIVEKLKKYDYKSGNELQDVPWDITTTCLYSDMYIAKLWSDVCDVLMENYYADFRVGSGLKQFFHPYQGKNHTYTKFTLI